MSDAAVRASGLVKPYDGSDDAVEAVRGVDLEVEAGEVFGFLGPNGAGKSTTVRMLTTLMTITGWPGRVAGVDVAQRSRRRPPADRRRPAGGRARPAPDRARAARPARAAVRLRPGKAHDRAQELLELVELEDAADRVIKGYSGGMKRRLDLASALVH